MGPCRRGPGATRRDPRAQASVAEGKAHAALPASGAGRLLMHMSLAGGARRAQLGWLAFSRGGARVRELFSVRWRCSGLDSASGTPTRASPERRPRAPCRRSRRSRSRTCPGAPAGSSRPAAACPQGRFPMLSPNSEWAIRSASSTRLSKPSFFGLRPLKTMLLEASPIKNQAFGGFAH